LDWAGVDSGSNPLHLASRLFHSGALIHLYTIFRKAWRYYSVIKRVVKVFLEKKLDRKSKNREMGVDRTWIGGKKGGM
jgi:hypothetical protein